MRRQHGRAPRKGEGGKLARLDVMVQNETNSRFYSTPLYLYASFILRSLKSSQALIVQFFLLHTRYAFSTRSAFTFLVNDFGGWT
jgi:hypothetical protein